MIKVRGFSSGVRMQHVYGWVSIVWFISSVRITVSEDMDLWAVSEVAARCGDNVTLTCDAILQNKLDIKSFTWEAENISCQYEASQPDPEVLCESTANTSTHRLTVTLRNVMPVNQGKFHCKLRSSKGPKHASTNVTVHDCFGTPGSSINETHAKCWFSGVYPRGIIHWSQGDVNLTDSSSTQEEKDQYGRYNIWSAIDLREGNRSLPFVCSPWIPSVGKYFPYHQVQTSEPQKSSGSTVSLQWICIIVEIMMVKMII